MKTVWCKRALCSKLYQGMCVKIVTDLAAQLFLHFLSSTGFLSQSLSKINFIYPPCQNPVIPCIVSKICIIYLVCFCVLLLPLVILL